MSKNRKDFLKAMLKKPLNMQKPLTDLPTAPTYPKLPSLQKLDTISKFDKYFKVFNGPANPHQKKAETQRKLITQLFQQGPSRKNRSKTKETWHSFNSQRGSGEDKKKEKSKRMKRSSSVKYSNKDGSRVEIRFIFNF